MLLRGMTRRWVGGLVLVLLVGGLTVWAQLAQASGCTITWNGSAGDGQWSTQANWTPVTGTARTPGSSDDVCIELNGTYTVTLNGAPTVGSLTVGTTTTSGTQTLEVTGSEANLTVTGGGTIGARGVIDDDQTGASDTLDATAGSWGNAGTIILAGDDNDGEPRLYGNVTNTGTIDVTAATAAYGTGGSDTLDNEGTIDLANGSTLSSDETVIDDTGGTIAATGSGQLQSTGTYQQGAGTTSGTQPVQVGEGALDYTGGGESTILEDSNTSLSGAMSSGQSLTLVPTTFENLGNQPTVTASSGFTAGGTITLAVNEETSLTLLEASGTLTNSGTINLTTAGGEDGPTYLNGNVTNTGTIDVRENAGFGPGPYGPNESATLDNKGTIDVADGAIFSSAGSETVIDDTGGTIAANGASGTGQLQTNGTYEQGAGTTTGTASVQITSGTLDYTGTGASTIVEDQSTTLVGNVAGGQSLTILGTGGTGNVTTSGGFSNAGAITIDADHLGMNLIIPSGNLTNSGTITLTGSNAPDVDVEGSGSSLINNGTITSTGAYQPAIDGNLTNTATGTIDVEQILGIDPYSTGAFNDDGVIEVAAGAALYVTAGATFTIQGGHIINDGTFDDGFYIGGEPDRGSGLAVEGGTATGNPVTVYTSGVSFAGTGTGTFDLVGTGAQLSGNIGAGDIVVLDATGTDGYGSSSLTAATGFTNDGTIELLDPDSAGAGSNTAELTVTSGTLTNDGTILSAAGAAGVGTREISGGVVNDGTLEVDQTLKQTGGMLVSAGTTDIAAGEALEANSTFTQTAGVMNDQGAIDVPGGFELTGGTLNGDGTVSGDLVNGGVVEPSPSPSTLTVTGTYSQSAGGTLDAGVTSTGSDQLSVTGAATLGGTLQVTTASGFTPTAGQTYEPLTASSVTDQFATTAGLSSGPYSIAYNPANVTLTALVQPPPTHQEPTLSISDPTVEAPDYGESPATFTVTLSSAQLAPVTVDYATANGTGVAGTDYVATSGQLTFPAGQTTEDVTVEVIGGTLGTDKTFLVELTSPSGASLATASATGTITHPSPNVSGAVDPSSGGNGGTVTVTISGGALFGTPTVNLVAPGLPTIAATDVTVSEDGTELSATFDLSGATPGLRSIVVLDGAASRTITNSFTVVPTIAPQVSVQMAGPAAIGPGVRWSGLLLYRNDGNVDAYGTVVEISGFPQGTAVQVTGATGQVLGNDLDGSRSITFEIGDIPASSSGAVGISFVAQGTVHDYAYLQAAVVSTSADPSEGPDPNATTTAHVTVNTAQELAGTVTVSDGAASETASVDVTLVAPPADGEPTVTTTGPASDETVTEILPPAPAPGGFGGSSQSCTPLVIGTGSDTIDTGCLVGGGGGLVAEASRADARRGGRAIARAASLGTWIKSVIGGLCQTCGVIIDSYDFPDVAKNAANQRAVDNCLVQAGLLDPNRLAALDQAANGQISVALASFLGTVAGGAAGGVTASLAATAISSQTSTGWEYVVYRNVSDSLAGNTSSVLVKNVAGLPDTANAANVTQMLNNIAQNPAFQNCIKNKKPCPAADVANARRPLDELNFPPPCEAPAPPPPPPFPIQLRTSGDPNDMVGPSGPGTVHWVAGTGGSPYTYTALFQNEPSATAPAYQVVVTDQLPASLLNLATLSLGPVRFGSHVITPPPGLQSWSTQVDLRPAQDTFVDVAGALDRATGVLTWTFTTIDASTGQPITDAINGFLPPDTTPPEGEGSVSFTVTPRAGLKTGTKIANLATIVFDINKPINTPTWVNEVDLTRPTSRIVTVRALRQKLRERVRVGHRLAVRSEPALRVSWRGSDRRSGIAGFELFAATGRSAFRSVTEVTAATSARVACTAGRSYRFYTVAFSNVGTEQRGHSRPSATVRCP